MTPTLSVGQETGWRGDKIVINSNVAMYFAISFPDSLLLSTHSYLALWQRRYHSRGKRLPTRLPHAPDRVHAGAGVTGGRSSNPLFQYIQSRDESKEHEDGSRGLRHGLEGWCEGQVTAVGGGGKSAFGSRAAEFHDAEHASAVVVGLEEFAGVIEGEAVGILQARGEGAFRSAGSKLEDGTTGVVGLEEVARTIECEVKWTVEPGGEGALGSVGRELVDAAAAVVGLEEVSGAVECERRRMIEPRGERDLDARGSYFDDRIAGISEKISLAVEGEAGGAGAVYTFGPSGGDLVDDIVAGHEEIAGAIEGYSDRALKPAGEGALRAARCEGVDGASEHPALEQRAALGARQWNCHQGREPKDRHPVQPEHQYSHGFSLQAPAGLPRKVSKLWGAVVANGLAAFVLVQAPLVLRFFTQLCKCLMPRSVRMENRFSFPLLWIPCRERLRVTDVGDAIYGWAAKQGTERLCGSRGALRCGEKDSGRGKYMAAKSQKSEIFTELNPPIGKVKHRSKNYEPA